MWLKDDYIKSWMSSCVESTRPQMVHIVQWEGAFLAVARKALTSLECSRQKKVYDTY